MPSTLSSGRRRRTAPKLKDSCDCCSSAKVKCSRERPECSRCQQKGSPCQYSFSRRAGRKMTSGSDASSATSRSSPEVYSYPTSPLNSPIMKPSFTHGMIRTGSTASIASTISSAYEPSIPFTAPEAQMLAPDSNAAQTNAFDMWANPPYVAAADDLNAEWYQLTNGLPVGPIPDEHHYFEPSSPGSSIDPDSIFDSIAPFQINNPEMASFPENLLFMETEAIREELHLVANFIGTLEERVDKGVRSSGSLMAPPIESAGLGERTAGFSIDEHDSMADSQLALQFSASDLRQKLRSIRSEIEGIVSFG